MSESNTSTPAAASAPEPQIQNYEFRPYAGKVAASGARTLGWVDFRFVREDGSFVEIHDLKVRVNARGAHTLCATSRKYKLADGSERTRSAYKFDDNTYRILVDAIFQTSDVVAALGAAPAKQELVLAS
jgi:hypothetical protein